MKCNRCRAAMIQVGNNVVCSSGAWDHELKRDSRLPRDQMVHNHTIVAIPDIVRARFSPINPRIILIPGSSEQYVLVKTYRKPLSAFPAEIKSPDMLVMIDNHPRWIAPREDK